MEAHGNRIPVQNCRTGSSAGCLTSRLPIAKTAAELSSRSSIELNRQLTSFAFKRLQAASRSSLVRRCKSPDDVLQRIRALHANYLSPSFFPLWWQRKAHRDMQSGRGEYAFCLSVEL